MFDFVFNFNFFGDSTNGQMGLPLPPPLPEKSTHIVTDSDGAQRRSLAVELESSPTIIVSC